MDVLILSMEILTVPAHGSPSKLIIPMICIFSSLLQGHVTLSSGSIGTSVYIDVWELISYQILPVRNHRKNYTSKERTQTTYAFENIGCDFFLICYLTR
mmetsp:Transcript_1598/g.1656  ORF Transcript_1598/g.1656 Transcript_1598/m.1656 type:complete len:99 (+) Transcript_1598:479-775(+)